ncbi:MAG TPA: hypothetical protein VN494_11700 [Patescibacteria group bacterium]|nr:hypothetical protein [Patescibacteria group bacterium]
MNRVKCAGALALAMTFMTVGAASAQQAQPCAMMKDHQMGGMQQQGMPGMGMGMMKQDKEMGGMQGCKMMEGMKGQHQSMIEMKKHLREMKKHMNMLDEMMDGMMDKMMMQRQQGMTPSGSESEPQEHHPDEDE